MNSSIQQLRKDVHDLYSAKHPNRADWANWLYEKHVLLVAEESRNIANKYGGNPDLAEAAGLLHDIADAVMKRDDPRHEEESLNIARTLLKNAGYSEDEISIIVDDAIVKHGCHGDIRPETLEGKAMASGDAVVHLMSDFYTIAEGEIIKEDSPQKAASWALPKLDRDFNNKIAYDDLREEVRPTYLKLKEHFEHLLRI